jgi:molybdopterin-guanine dinucleotide biosynthesis protein A
MHASGFVLAGGGSTRMGRDKALLPYRGAALVEHIASLVREAAGSVALIGDPRRYARFGYPVHPDNVPHCGPLGGIHTALTVTTTDWNMVVACDMPAISHASLDGLLRRAARTERSCVVATGPGGEPEPLCAVYHRRSLPVLARAIQDKRFRLRDLVPELDAEAWALDGPSLANVNTPAEWVEFAEDEPR